MTIEIDQSGKVEDTSVKTVVGDSLGNFVVLRARDKRAIQSIYVLSHQPKVFMVQTFSLLCTMLIRKTYRLDVLYRIDVEYPGREEEIRSLIILFAKKIGFEISPDVLRFERIGKASSAHATAHSVFTKKNVSEHESRSEILKILLPMTTKKDRAFVSR